MNCIASAIAASVITTSVVAQLPCDESTGKVSPLPFEKFQAIERGTSIDSVRTIIGEPSCLGGYGIVYDVYHLEDGRVVSIAYPRGVAQ